MVCASIGKDCVVEETGQRLLVLSGSVAACLECASPVQTVSEQATPLARSEAYTHVRGRMLARLYAHPLSMYPDNSLTIGRQQS